MDDALHTGKAPGTGHAPTGKASGAGIGLTELDIQQLTQQFAHFGDSPAPSSTATAAGSGKDPSAGASGGKDVGVGLDIDVRDIQELTRQLVRHDDPPVPPKSPGLPGKLLAGIAAGVGAIVIGTVIIVSGGGGTSDTATTDVPSATTNTPSTTEPTSSSSATSTTTTPTSTTTAPTTTVVTEPARAPIPSGTSFTLAMTSTAAFSGLAPPNDSPRLPVAVGDTFTGTFVFQGECTPDNCVARYSDTAAGGTYALWGLALRYFYPPNGDIAFAYTDGIYIATASGQAGCNGFPLENYPTTAASLAFNFSVTKTEEGPSGVVATEIQGTASSSFAEPVVSWFAPGEEHYCENTSGTVTFTGIPG